MPTVEDVYSELRQVYDPEIPVNIVDLGLIYEVDIKDSACSIRMTLTAQACPEARNIPEMVKRRVGTLEGLESCEVEVVWEPPWGPQLISAEGRRILGLPEEV